MTIFSFPGGNDCYLWTTDPSPDNQKQASAITVDSTSYALLAAVELGKSQWADRIACWLTTQENYLGGFKSSQVMKTLRLDCTTELTEMFQHVLLVQDTLNALEALAEYSLRWSVSPEVSIVGEFSVKGRNEIIKLELEKGKHRVETDLKVQSAIHTTFHQMIDCSSLLPAAFVPEICREQHSGAADRKWQNQVKSKMKSCLDYSWKKYSK